MELKIGDRVRISKSSMYYNDNCITNPKCEGIVYELIGSRFLVEWKNGSVNGYDQNDLELVNMKTYQLIKEYPGSSTLGTTTTEDMSKFPEYWEEVKYQIGDIVVVKSANECGERNGINKSWKICRIVPEYKGATGMLKDTDQYYVNPLNHNPKSIFRIRESHIIRKATKEEIEKATLVFIGEYKVEKYKCPGDIKVGCQIISKYDVDTIKRFIDSPINADITIHGTKITLDLINKIENL